MLTSVEAAKASGITPSTFRAYVARGQAPRPRDRVGGVNLWSIVDLASWRNLDLDDRQRRGIRAEVAIMYARGRDWEESTRRYLAQVGVDHRSAQSLIDGYTVGGMPVDTFLDAVEIIRIRRRLKERLTAALGSVEPDDTSEETYLRRAAENVADGRADAFTAMSDLTYDLTTHGYAERLVPPNRDPEFWSSQYDEQDFVDYLKTLPRADIPTVA